MQASWNGVAVPKMLNCCVGAKLMRSSPPKALKPQFFLVSAAALEGVGCVVAAAMNEFVGFASAAVKGLCGPSEFGDDNAVCAPVSLVETRAKTPPHTALAVEIPTPRISRISTHCVAAVALALSAMYCP